MTPDLPLEGCAARTAIDVGACHAAGQDAAAHRRQSLADLRARMLPRPTSTGQPLAGLEYQRLDFLFAHAEHSGDFVVRVIGELEQNERGALVGREPLQVIQHLANVLPALDHVCHTLPRGSILRHVADIDVAASAELRQAAVPRDRIEPGPERHFAVAPSQCPERRDEGQLKRILGRLAVPQHVHAEREYAASVSIVDRLERGIIPGAQARYEKLVSFAQGNAAIEPTAEPGDCRVHPHALSVRYRAPKVQRPRYPMAAKRRPGNP
ncbi:MAG TPA: hypothetical protein VG057_15965 [Solirubrobacteraceae bacterium]|nr:hypothetical protein [Solirubrobacteraceae bacterium]